MQYKSLALIVLTIPFSFAWGECQQTNEQGYEKYSAGQYSYECNVKNLCLWQRYGGDAWNFDTNKQLIVKHTMGKYPDLSKTKAISFDDVRKIYEDTQNNIMNCAILKSKFALHKKIIDDYDISERAKEILKKANDVIEEQIKEQKPEECVPPRDEDKIYTYKDLLDSMTYEQCGYNMYLYYYQQNAEKNIGILGAGKQVYNVSEWAKVQKTETQKIAQEYELTRKTMDTALSMYENFEKTYIAHVLLEMIEVELTEDKRYIWGTVRVIQQLVSLWSNAQMSESTR
jgi:hypothetical protein